MLNLQLAKAYLAGTDAEMPKRTWQHALEVLTETKRGANKERWKRVPRIEHFPCCGQGDCGDRGRASSQGPANRHSLHERLPPAPLQLLRGYELAAVAHCSKETMAHCPVSGEEGHHLGGALSDRRAEKNPERKAFYQLAWYLGASQSDLAHLQAEDVDWPNRVISFFRMKTRWRSLQPPQIRFGREVEAILSTLPKIGPLFPSLANVRPGDRATEFKQRCDGLGIRGISLHSYRYSWAERAKIAGYPERFAQLALGHNSKAVHRAYAKKAQVTLPPLEEYEVKIVPFVGVGPAVEVSPATATGS